MGNKFDRYEPRRTMRLRVSMDEFDAARRVEGVDYRILDDGGHVPSVFGVRDPSGRSTSTLEVWRSRRADSPAYNGTLGVGRLMTYSERVAITAADTFDAIRIAPDKFGALHTFPFRGGAS